MGILRKVIAKAASPLDRYIKRRMDRYVKNLECINKKIDENSKRLSEVALKMDNAASTQRIRKEALNAVECQTLPKVEHMIQKVIAMPRLNFDVHLAEHCNLNCSGCDNFSPIADEELLDLKEYERDCKRLSQLFNGKAERIQFIGGEPLLNPQIIDFMRITRECFPDTYSPNTRQWRGALTAGGISITTNGILLPKMGEDFWQACRKYDVAIRPTKYPIAFDYDAMERLAKSKGVRYEYFNNACRVKTLFKLPLDLTGSQPVMHNFLKCHRSNVCLLLRHGKLFTCAVAASADHFKKRFALDIELSEDNGIDIYKASSANEIMAFLARPIPFCRYCNIDGTKWNLPWHTSDRTIDEWT